MVDNTDGNPLGIVEIARRLTDAQRVGAAPLPDVMPVGDRLRIVYEPSARLMKLTGDTRLHGRMGPDPGSGEIEHEREDEDDCPRPDGVHDHVTGLPAFQAAEGHAATQEAEEQPRRPRQVGKQNDVLA